MVISWSSTPRFMFVTLNQAKPLPCDILQQILNSAALILEIQSHAVDVIWTRRRRWHRLWVVDVFGLLEDSTVWV